MKEKLNILSKKADRFSYKIQLLDELLVFWPDKIEDAEDEQYYNNLLNAISKILIQEFMVEIIELVEDSSKKEIINILNQKVKVNENMFGFKET